MKILILSHELKNLKMRWNKITSQHGVLLYWECVFVNVPFIVRIVDEKEYWKAGLLFQFGDHVKLLTSETYPSIGTAKSEVESFVLDHLALYSAQVHRECLEANVMTWRKLKEQLDQIPEDQLDEAINHLDTDGYWVGEPRIELADEDQYAEIDDFRDVTGSVVNPKDYSLVVEKGKYFLSTCQV